MKYHRLNEEQLKAMHEEFSVFLAAQSIDKKAWDTIKSTQPERVDTFIDTFSDMVWEKVLNTCNYLEWNDQRQLFLFHCKSDSISVYIIKVLKESINLETPSGWQWLVDHFFDPEVTLYTSSKVYDGSRNLFLYDYIKKGAVITAGARYNEIATYFSKSSK